MAISRVLLSHLRRTRGLSSSLSLVSLSLQSHSFDLASSHHHPPAPRVCSLAHYYFSHSRSFSALPEGGYEPSGLVISDDGSALESIAGLEEYGFLTRSVISSLDWVHDVTGLPWWIVIASSTVAIRTALLPFLVLQLKKTKRISEFLPKLPPLRPPPGSGRSYINQFLLFRKERIAAGCPSFLWVPAYFSVQVSCFLLWLTSVRRMSVDHHPGFDCGGALWFQNLTEIPNGLYGPVFPLLIAGLHYANTQISFQRSSVSKLDKFDTLAKNYKRFMNFMTFVIYFLSYQIPQGSLVYWVSNLSFNIAQQSFLKHPVLRAKLGLIEKHTDQKIRHNEIMKGDETEDSNSPQTGAKGRMISLQDLSAQELVAVSVQYLSKGQKEKPISLLKLALEKDPENGQAMVTLGQALLQQNQLPEATEFLERAASKILAGCPTEAKDVDLLLVASQWAGVANIRQGKTSEGLAHLQRVADMKEPDDPKSKAHYFDAMVLLSSALYNNGDKEEASKYLRLAAAYDPAHKQLLEQCEKDDNTYGRDLDNSRRVG